MSIILGKLKNCKIVIGGVLMAILAWILDLIIHVHLFDDKPSLHLIFYPDLHHQWMRLLIFFLFASFSVIIQIQVNKRRKVEEALRRSEREKSMILDTASAFIAYMDDDDNILWVNKAAVEYSSARNPEEIIGKKCYQVWQQLNEPCTHCPARKARITGKLEEGEMTLPDGKILNITASAVMNSKGDVTGVIEIATDITRRKRAEERVKELNEILMLMNKTLRHDILNDLTVISNSIEVYRDAANREILNYAFNSIEKSVKLIKEMRELESLIYSGKDSIKPCNVRKCIEDVLKSYPVEFTVEGDSIALADGALSSVFDNIIRNAIDHGRAGKIDVGIRDTGDYCEIRIADDGIGIPDEIKNKIFEEGFSRGNGTGLGLYIVKRTVDRYGGSVKVEDNHPSGAVFVISLIRPKEEEIKRQNWQIGFIGG